MPSSDGTSLRAARTCLWITTVASPASRSDRVSPTHRIGCQLHLDGRGDFPGHHLVGLAKLLPPLRMAEDDVVAEFLDHRGRDLPRIRPLGLVVQVLGSHEDIRAFETL